LRNVVLHDFIGQKESRLKKFLQQLAYDEAGLNATFYLKEGSLAVHSPIVKFLAPGLYSMRHLEDIELSLFRIFVDMLYDLDSTAHHVDPSILGDLLALARRFQANNVILKLQQKQKEIENSKLESTPESEAQPNLEKEDGDNHPESDSSSSEKRDVDDKKNGQRQDVSEQVNWISAVELFENLFGDKEVSGDFEFYLQAAGSHMRVHKWIISKWDRFEYLIDSYNARYDISSALEVSTIQKLIRYYYCEDVTSFTPNDSSSILKIADEFHIDSSLRNLCFQLSHKH